MNNIDLSGVESILDAIANSQGNISSTSSFLTAILTSFATFILCEVAKYFIFDPYVRYKKIREKISYFITLYYPCCTKPIESTDENEHSTQAQEYRVAKEDIRRCAAELMSVADLLPSKYICCIPKKEELYAASKRLYVLASKPIHSVWEQLENQGESYWDESVDVLVSNIKKSLKINSRSVEEKP